MENEINEVAVVWLLSCDNPKLSKTKSAQIGQDAWQGQFCPNQALRLRQASGVFPHLHGMRWKQENCVPTKFFPYLLPTLFSKYWPQNIEGHHARSQLVVIHCEILRHDDIKWYKCPVPFNDYRSIGDLRVSTLAQRIQHPTGWIFSWLKERQKSESADALWARAASDMDGLRFSCALVQAFIESDLRRSLSEDLQMENFSSPQNKTAQINLSKCGSTLSPACKDPPMTSLPSTKRSSRKGWHQISWNVVGSSMIFHIMAKPVPHLSGRNLTWQRLLDRGTGCPWGLNSKTLRP